MDLNRDLARTIVLTAPRGATRRGLGREVAMREATQVLCRVSGDERRRELESLNAAELTALLARLGEQKRWA